MVNKVILIGNLTADPEVKATPKGVFVATLRLATNTYTGKDDEGNSKEETEFHNLVIFGKRAEFAGEHLRKGRLLYAEGRLRTRIWTDTAGLKHYKTEIVLDDIEMLGPKPQEVAA
ncbi:MAG TPA: single-stranded DNA-binding protein [Candidatus Dormibacteraeota bacterium]|jgi:single-strand DNA-binding protein|nr:single-stranded DNA-binding protein [Candidatus Dormibacteraeota bacterium]